MALFRNIFRINSDYNIVRKSALFDAGFYLKTYRDVGVAGIQPLTHYMEYGHKEGKRPCAIFDPKYYLDANPDVARAGLNPLVHWLRHGMREGRSAFFNDDGQKEAFQEKTLVLASGLFDAIFYAAKYPDADNAGLSPVDHYMRYGGLEGRSPSPNFDAARYLRDNPDVVAKGINPIVHWLRSGRFERRRSPVREVSQFRLQDFCRPRHLEDSQKICFPGFGVSVLTPTYNTEPYLLRELYQSIVNQTYNDWEWILVDDCSQSWSTLSALRQLANEDTRVKLFLNHKNLGISNATNLALANATKDFIALVDHDDLLARDAFRSAAIAWKKEPDLDLLYTDECKLSVDEEIQDILLKPDYSPSYIESTMYTSHLSIYRKDVIKRVGAFRPPYDGTQDFDLALRVFYTTDRIRHVPGIGYLWRAIPNSTAFSLESKPYAVNAQRQAVLDYALRRHPGARVLAGRKLGFWHIDYPLQGQPLVSFVIPTAGASRNGEGVKIDLLENCLESLDKSSFCRNREYLVLHDGNLDNARLARLRRNARVRLIHYDSRFFNLSDKINLGVTSANGEFVCLLNDDTQALTESGGDKLVAYMQATPNVGAMSALLLFSNLRVRHNGIVILEQGPTNYAIDLSEDTLGHANQFGCRRDVTGVSGAMMFVRKADFEAIGGFDTRLPCKYNDVDFCLRLRAAGRTCVVDPYVRVLHFESASEPSTHSERERLLSLHPGLSDRFFNPLLDQRDPSTIIDESGESGGADTADAFRVWLDRRIRKRAGAFVGSPDLKFTVGMPIFDQSADLLKEAYRSLVMQTHPSVEIIIVDDGSSRPATVRWIEEVSRDPRSLVIRHGKRLGINEAKLAVIKNMTGYFLVFVDANDYITVDALQVMSDAIRRSPDGRIFYSDQFVGDMQSRNSAPFFKPDYDPVLVLNCGYSTHLTAIRKDLLDEIDDPKATWRHAYCSILNALARGENPVHVPELLYAQRNSLGSTGSITENLEPETLISQRFVKRLLSLKGLSHDVMLQPNALFDHRKMWRIATRDFLPDVKIVDAEDLWRGGDARGRLALAANESGFTALLAKKADQDSVLKELSALLLCDRRVVAGSGICVSSDRIVRWSGGLFGAYGVIEPYAGGVFAAGYHNQLYLQRCTDVLFPINLLIRNEDLKELLKVSGGSLGSTDFVITLGRYAQEKKLFVAVTPHVLYDGGGDPYEFVPLDRTYSGSGPVRTISRWLGPFAPGNFSQ